MIPFLYDALLWVLHRLLILWGIGIVVVLLIAALAARYPHHDPEDD